MLINEEKQYKDREGNIYSFGEHLGEGLVIMNRHDGLSYYYTLEGEIIDPFPPSDIDKDFYKKFDLVEEL